ncbi:MAG: histidine--tRNA ligase [Marinilabiliales bacterium]
MNKPSLPKGTRDFSPEEMTRRNYIFNVIQEIFERYGYAPIETPAMENLSTLLGKYGEEGDKLIFKILNNGDFLKKVNTDDLASKNSSTVALQISEKGLRYDLTVPFARYVVQNRHNITFPFKRYQIQPVWRADKPQKGRYREFYQCDVDVIGSDSLLNEFELILIIDDIFKKLKIDVTIKINNRKILNGIAEYLGYKDKFIDITVTLDKLEKIGLINVKEELRKKGIKETAINKLEDILNFSGNNIDKVKHLQKIFKNTEIGIAGVAELNSLLSYLDSTELNSNLIFDLTLARGLNYYTGTIIEVVSKDKHVGSICGGGRYDNLAGIFGLENVSGVGISFGADRIYDTMEHLNLFSDNDLSKTKIMFINFGEKEVNYCLPLLKKLRDSGINSELYPDNAKIKKQFSYANNKNIEFVAIAGEDEIKAGKITLKNMISGEQKTILKDELILELKWEL